MAGDIWGVADFSSPPDIHWVSCAALLARNSVLPVKHVSSEVGSVCLVGSVAPACGTPDRDSYHGTPPPRLILAGDLSLHNRNELRRALGQSHCAEGCSDQNLVLAAFEKWGEECGRYLLGEFAFAIWDEFRKQLFCCRDHMGFRSLFYWSDGSRFVFGSDPRFVLSVPGVPCQLNKRKFAGTVVHSGHAFYHEDTFHSGILSLPGASTLTIGRDGIRRRTYWEPEVRANLVPRRPDEAFEALRELLFQAVECRIPEGSQAAVTLSGGLDSSSVAAIAARLLEKQGRTLLALSGVLPEERRIEYSDEREFIDEFRSWPNVRIEHVTACGRGPFDSITDPGQFVVTPIRNPFNYLKNALAETAISNGALTMMHGSWGEFGPTQRGDRYLLELVLQCRWPTLIRELHKIREVQHIRPVRYLGGRFLDLFRPYPASRRDPHVLLTAEFRRHGEALRPFGCAWPDQRRQTVAEIRYLLRAHADWWARTRQEHIRSSYPLIDKRVIEFCLSAPPSLKIRGGYSRYLVRGSLNGVLPKAIQWRKSKTPFSPDYNLRYNSQLPKAREFVAAIGPKDPVRSAIDVAHLSRLMDPVDPLKVSKIARDVVPANIYAICFLRQFAEFRP